MLEYHSVGSFNGRGLHWKQWKCVQVRNWNASLWTICTKKCFVSQTTQRICIKCAA